MQSDTRQAVLTYLAAGVAEARRRLDAASGRFLAENGGWAVTNQDVIYPLAILYKTPGTECYRDAAVAELAFAGGDALAASQDERGMFEFVKPDGSRWGKIYMPWSMYHWLEAYGLLADDLEPARRQRWERGLRLCFGGHAPELAKLSYVHNIPTWHGMALVRAGQIFGERQWEQIGRDVIYRALAVQDADGCWPEGGGPTTLYNLVYVHAAGLYYWFTRDESVLPKLRRALDFHLHFTYPDGAAVETVDGRCRYHGGVNTTGLPGFAVSPPGRRYVRFLLEQLGRSRKADRPSGRRPASLDPRVTAWLQHVPAEGQEEPIALERRQFAAVHDGRGLVCRQGPWFCCLSGYLRPTDHLAGSLRCRWHLDRQHYLSVWHEELGLLVGGGNSKHSPVFSTFQVVAGRVIRIQADAAELSHADGRSLLRLAYGKTICELAVTVPDDRRLEVSCRATTTEADPTTIRASLCLPLLAGRTFASSRQGDPVVLDGLRTNELAWPPEDASPERWVRLGRLRVDLPAGSDFAWPEYPFNPYAIDNTAKPEDAVGVVSTALAPDGQPKSFTLTVA